MSSATDTNDDGPALRCSLALASLPSCNTAQEFHTTNGVRAHGGSLNGAGPAIVDGVLYVNSGYTNAMGGNVLLAFAPDSK